VVAAAGNLDHAQVVRLVKQAFSTVDAGAAPAPHGGTAPRALRGQIRVRDKDTEQAHVILGGTGIERHDERRFAVGVLNNVVGGGMSSRLFQEIREKRGLAYSVYSFTSQYADAGLFGVYAGCAPGKVDEVLELTRAELARVAAGDLTGAEVARGKGMLKGSIVLGLEDTGSRMTRLGKGELLYGDVLGVDELLSKVDAVDLAAVNEMAAELLDQRMSLAIIGPFAEQDFAADL
jgi:predicted Zn-dependent peptidase